jgi:uncharacterized protein YjhX (UPF0386 family)
MPTEYILDWNTFVVSEYDTFSAAEHDTFSAYEIGGPYSITAQGSKRLTYLNNTTNSGGSRSSLSLDWSTMTEAEYLALTDEQWLGLTISPTGGPYSITAQGSKRLTYLSNTPNSGGSRSSLSLDWSTLTTAELTNLTDEQIATLTAYPIGGPYRITAQGSKQLQTQGIY